jgi:hypothetical protein
MNNTFNIQRFSRLLNKQTKDNYASYLMSLVVLIGILVITMGITCLLDKGRFDSGTQVGFYATFLILAGSIFTSMVFSDLGDKKKAIPALTLPVSHFEKFLVGWLYSFIIFFLVFTLSFAVVNFLVITVGNNYQIVQNEFMKPKLDSTPTYAILMAYCLLHAVALFGAIYFARLHFIKSSFAFFISLFLIWMADQPIARVVFGDAKVWAVPFVGVLVPDGRGNSLIRFDQNALVYSVIIAVIILLWTAAYFKLKEKEV